MSDSMDWGKIFDNVLGSLPFGQIAVWGEGILQMFWPGFSEVKQEVAYFVAYAEAAQTGPGQGQDKRAKVINAVWNDISKDVPSWVPSFLAQAVIGSLIDGIVAWLNKNVPNWTQLVQQYFLNPQATTNSSVTPSSNTTVTPSSLTSFTTSNGTDTVSTSQN